MKISFKSKVQGQCIEFDLPVDPGESIYEAAQNYALKLPVACRNGVCQICRASLSQGRIEVGARRTLLKVKKSCEPQEIMMCQSWPQSDCVLEVKNVLKPGELPLNNISCQVTTVEIIKGHVYRVVLRLPAGKLPEFYAGQYLSVQLPAKDAPCYYSIASRPGIREITLHIQADPHLVSAVEVVDHFKSAKENNECVSITLPMGSACLTSVPKQRLILMAAGTGFAQMTSIIEHVQSLEHTLPIDLYWGVRKEADMYLRDEAMRWEQEYANFTFHPLVADIENIEDNAHHNQLSDAVLRDFSDISDALVFVSGSPKLVFSAMDALMDAGLQESQFFSDVLEYASR